MPGLGVGSEIGTGNIGISHDDGVELSVRWILCDKEWLTALSVNRVAPSVGTMLSSGEVPTA